MSLETVLGPASFLPGGWSNDAGTLECQNTCEAFGAVLRNLLVLWETQPALTLASEARQAGVWEVWSGLCLLRTLDCGFALSLSHLRYSLFPLSC